MLKICSKCQENKLESEYYLNTNGKPLTYCKVCRKQQIIRHNNIISTNKNKISPNTKTCFTCKLNKSATEFYRNKYRIDGLTDECKECSKLKANTNRQKYSSGQFIHKNITLKTCYRCGLNQSIESYNKNRSSSDGRSSECRICVNNYNKLYRNTMNKVKVAEYNKQYRNDNKEKLKAKHKIYKNLNKDEMAIRQHKWYEKNKDSVKTRTAKSKKSNPKQHSNYANKRRAKKKSLFTEKFSTNDIINKYGDKCFYCSGVFEHIDHYIPLSKNGTHTLDNVRPSCKKCNLCKNSKSPEDWYKYYNKLKEQ